MGRIYKRNDIWYLDLHIKGRRVRKRVGKSKKVAELALSDAEVRIAKDEFGFSKKDITIDDLIDKFIEYNQTNNRESTTKRYRTVMDHFQRFLTEKQQSIAYISQLTPEVIEGYKAYRKSEWVNPNG